MDFLEWKCINKISVNFVLKGPVNNIITLVQIMAWRRPGDKPLSEPMMITLLRHLCVIELIDQPQCYVSDIYEVYVKILYPWLLSALALEIPQSCTSHHQYICPSALQLRHNGCDGISNHQPHHSLLNCLFRRRLKKNIKAQRHWPLCGEFNGDQWTPSTKGQ